MYFGVKKSNLFSQISSHSGNKLSLEFHICGSGIIGIVASHLIRSNFNLITVISLSNVGNELLERAPEMMRTPPLI